MEVTFGSVGDFISLVQIIKDIITALNDSRGSARDFQELSQTLQTLADSLQEVEKIFNDADFPKDLESLHNVAVETARQITQRATEFQAKITKYAPSLSKYGSGNKIKDAARKIEWKLNEGDVEKFRGEIMGYTSSLEIILNATTIQMMKSHQTDMQKRVGFMENRILTAIKEQAQGIQSFANHFKSHATFGIQSILSMGNDIALVPHRVLVITFAVYRELRSLHALVTRLDRPITEEQFTLEDAIGRRFPIHLRTVISWDILEHIIREQFKGRNGEKRVARRKYELLDHGSKDEINRSISWQRAFRPHQMVNMSILCNENVIQDRPAQAKSCPWCHRISDSDQVKEIQCDNCNMFYTRVIQSDETTAKNKERQDRVPRMTKKFHKDVEQAGDSCHGSRRIRTSRTKDFNDLQSPSSVELELESDEDNLNGLVRVKVICKKRKKSHDEQALTSSSYPAVDDSVAQPSLLRSNSAVRPVSPPAETSTEYPNESTDGLDPGSFLDNPDSNANSTYPHFSCSTCSVAYNEELRSFCHISDRTFVDLDDISDDEDPPELTSHTVFSYKRRLIP